MHSSAYPVSRKAFKATACVDWLDVEFCTSRHTQFQHIQDWLEKQTTIKHYVEPIDPQEDKGNIAKTFRIRFHDDLANDAKALRCIFRELAKDYPLVTVPRITAIEVACDFRHKRLSVTESLALTRRLQTHFYVAAGTRHRQFDPAMRGTAANGNRFLDHNGDRINPKFNLRVGNKWDDLSWQIYYKRHDRIKVKGEKPPLLPEKDWRARVETTIQGEVLTKLGLVSLDDLQRFRFDRLAHLFRFRRPIAPEKLATPDDWYKYEVANIQLLRKLHDATSERGMHSFDAIGRHTKYRKMRGESRHIEPDNELQNAVKGALKRLHCDGDCANFSDKIQDALPENPHGCEIDAETPISCVNTIEQDDYAQHPEDFTSPSTTQRTSSWSPASASPRQAVTRLCSAVDQHNDDDTTLAMVALPPRPP